MRTLLTCQRHLLLNRETKPGWKRINYPNTLLIIQSTDPFNEWQFFGSLFRIQSINIGGWSLYCRGNTIQVFRHHDHPAYMYSAHCWAQAFCHCKRGLGKGYIYLKNRHIYLWILSGYIIMSSYSSRWFEICIGLSFVLLFVSLKRCLRTKIKPTEWQSCGQRANFCHFHTHCSALRRSPFVNTRPWTRGQCKMAGWG